MDILSILLGVTGSYFIYTKNGQKQAKKAIDNSVKMIKKYTNHYMKELLPDIPDEEIIEVELEDEQEETDDEQISENNE